MIIAVLNDPVDMHHWKTFICFPIPAPFPMSHTSPPAHSASQQHIFKGTRITLGKYKCLFIIHLLKNHFYIFWFANMKLVQYKPESSALQSSSTSVVSSLSIFFWRHLTKDAVFQFFKISKLHSATKSLHLVGNPLSFCLSVSVFFLSLCILRFSECVTSSVNSLIDSSGLDSLPSHSLTLNHEISLKNLISQL